MRLICPRCGAEYEVEDRLIPAGGREVQCSSCDHVWFQLGRLRMLPPVAPPAAAAAQEAAPRMGRALPEDVMGILRDEAAHFRASHPGLDAAPAVAAPADPDDVATGANPPAAGVVPLPKADPAIAPDKGSAPDKDRADSAAAPIPAAADDPAPETASAADAMPPSKPVTVPSAQGAPTLAAADAAAVKPATAGTPSGEWQRPAAVGPAKRSGGFGRGFLIGLIITAGFYALYRAEPGAGDGVWGDVLRGIRAGGDAFHHWVQARIAAFR